MKTFKTCLSLVSLGSAIALAAHAQVPAATNPPMTPNNPSSSGAPTPGVNAGSSASTNVEVPAQKVDDISKPGEADLGSGAGGVYVPPPHGEVRARVNGPGAKGAAAGSIAATLDAGPTVRVIESRSIAAREELATEIDQRIDASSHAVASLKRQARSLDDEAQTEFDAAMKDVALREKQLKRSAKHVRKATSENWEEARSAVAADYSAYAQAVMRAEAAAGSAKAGSLSGVRGTGTVEPTAAERE